MSKKNHLKSTTGNPSQVIHQIDTEIEYVIDYFNKNNIPYHLENGIPIREDLPDYIDMMCVKCMHQYKMDYDTYMELLEEIDPFELMEYLVIECPKCHKGDMVPKKYYLKHLL